MTNIFMKGLRDSCSFSFTGTCRPGTAIFRSLGVGHGRAMEQLELIPRLDGGNSRAAVTPADVASLAAGTPNIRELHIEITCDDGWVSMNFHPRDFSSSCCSLADGNCAFLDAGCPVQRLPQPACPVAVKHPWISYSPKFPYSHRTSNISGCHIR